MRAARGDGETPPTTRHQRLASLIWRDVLFVARANLGIVREHVVGRWCTRPSTQDEDAIEVLRSEGGHYVPAGYFGRGAVLTSHVRVGLTLRVEEVFARAG